MAVRSTTIASATGKARMFQNFVLGLSVLLMLTSSWAEAGRLRVSGLEDVEYVSPGDINLGILTAVHPAGTKWCSSSRIWRNTLPMTELLHFSFEQINARDDVLPNITLGFIMREDCFSTITSLAQTTQFVTAQNTCPGNEVAEMDTRRVVGILGPGTSTQAVAVSTFAGVFEIPVLAPKATSDELRDKKRFVYFMRMVPPDYYQTRAIIDILLHFGWRYVSLVYSEGNYGENAAKQMEKGLQHTEVCIAFSHRISSLADGEEYQRLADGLIRNKNAKVIVSFVMYNAQFRLMMEKLEEARENDSFLFVGGDTTIGKLETHRLHGSLYIAYDQYDVPGAVDFIKSQPCYGSGNPWAAEWCDTVFACEQAGVYCPDDMTFGYNGTQSRYIDSVGFHADWADAIHVYAHALHDLILSRCPSAFVYKYLLHDCVEGSILLTYMKKVTFFGNTGEIEFTEEGDRKGEYLLAQVNVQESGEALKVIVGKWSMLTGNLTIYDDKLWWERHVDGTREHEEAPDPVPESVCSQPCQEREYPQRLELPCCWECRKCRENERLLENNTGCETCDPFTWPDDVIVTRCVELNPVYLRPFTAVGLALLCLASILLLYSGGTFGIIVKHSNRKLIKACSRDLSLMILCGSLLACVISFVFVARPSVYVCTVRSVGFHLAISLIYAPQLVKSIRIYRIFAAGRKGNSRPSLISNSVQMMFTVAILVTQLVLLCVTEVLWPSLSRLHMPIPTLPYVEMSCARPVLAFLLLLSLNLVLILACAVLGFLTRKLPENFNDSWYIFLSVSSTLFMWVVFLPTYFTMFYAVYKAAMLLLCLLLNAAITVGCQFAPKLYALYYVQEEKMKFSTTGTTSTAVSSVD